MFTVTPVTLEVASRCGSEGQGGARQIMVGNAVAHYTHTNPLPLSHYKVIVSGFHDNAAHGKIPQSAGA